MSTHNIGFYEDLTKIIFELSSNTHLISSAGLINLTMRLHDILYNKCVTKHSPLDQATMVRKEF